MRVISSSTDPFSDTNVASRWQSWIVLVPAGGGELVYKQGYGGSLYIDGWKLASIV